LTASAGLQALTDAEKDAEFEAEASLFEDDNADIPESHPFQRKSLNYSDGEIRPLHSLTLRGSLGAVARRLTLQRS
jgi:hypothetical protein